MKTIILCGGKGERLKEETEFKPKPMVEIGGKPILWHIMKIYAHQGFDQFILALGYKGYLVKDYFLNHRLLANDFTIGTSKNSIKLHSNGGDDFKITFAETGLESLTGERILRLKKYIDGDEFMVTYGDGVSDIDLKKLLRFHRKQKTIGTVTGVHPYSKYGLMEIDAQKNRLVSFQQKPRLGEYVNGGFMVFNKKVFDYLDNGTMEEAFPRMAEKGEMSVYCHDGFWKAMDTYREMEELNEFWTHARPWAVWERPRA
ncbi:MAG: Uncharacterized protein G01um101433_753 [Parcubacteria group bacterium Gr01-1014_33]|nr:MAG: Uncharacterized protein G01um101433_753 [Parcubacteria group bacterium Gr01-1014_33]